MNKQGSIVFSLLLVLVLTILSAGILLRSVNENKIANRTSNSAQAFWLAEAGIQKVIWEKNSHNCMGMVRQGTATACSDCTCGGVTKALAVTVPGAGDIDVTLDSGNTILQSTGSVPSRTSTSQIQRAVQGTLAIQSPFKYAAFAQDQVILTNNTFIDSYNSDNEAYSNLNSSTNGDIGSNGTGAGAIVIGSNISLGGDVSTGPGGTVTTGNNTDIAGTSDNHNNNVTLPNVVVPPNLTGLASGGTFLITGTSNLPTGDYKYSAVDMENNATLNITGEVRLYLTGTSAFSTGNNVSVNIVSGASLQVFVDGVVSITNNVTLNSAGDLPENLQIYSTYTGANGISISNNGILSAAIYAPKTNISIGNNNDLYGSVIGKTVSVNNNSAIHFDETLPSLVTPVGTIGLTNWQEI
jgi:hypothetical protein